MAHLNRKIKDLYLETATNTIRHINKCDALESRYVIIRQVLAFNEITPERREISEKNSITPV